MTSHYLPRIFVAPVSSGTFWACRSNEAVKSRGINLQYTNVVVMACTKPVKSCYLNQRSPEFCYFIESSGLYAAPVNQGGSQILTPGDPCVNSLNMNHFWLWCSVESCWREQIHKLKTEYLLIWQKYLSTWSTSSTLAFKYKYVTRAFESQKANYPIICIKYQVPSTSTLPDPTLYTMSITQGQLFRMAFHIEVKRWMETWQLVNDSEKTVKSQ